MTATANTFGVPAVTLPNYFERWEVDDILDTRCSRGRRGEPLSCLSKRQHDFAEAGIRLQPFVRIAKLIDGIHTVDHRANPAARY